MSRVAVQPELYRWARERARLSEAVLRERFPKYDAWEKGEAQPTLAQLEAFAKKTHAPLGYFFLQQPPEEKLPVPDFRTAADAGVLQPSPNLIETIQMMQRRQEWMRDELIEQGAEPLSFVGAAKGKRNHKDMATQIADVLEFPGDWSAAQPNWSSALSRLRSAIEEIGVLVVINSIVGNNTTRKLDPNEFRGFVLVDAYVPLIFVNGADAKAAQLFTLAHELAHVWQGTGGIFDAQDFEAGDSDAERFCNRVAAEFLMPEASVRQYWQDAQQQEAPLQALAKRYKVSAPAAARRARDLGLMSQDDYQAFYKQYLAEQPTRPPKRKGGGSFYATQDFRLGRRFATAVIRAAKEGRLLYRDAYALTGLSGKTFDQYARKLGFRMDE